MSREASVTYYLEADDKPHRNIEPKIAVADAMRASTGAREYRI